MEYKTGKELLKMYPKHEIVTMMLEKKLTPYSPSKLKPYQVVILAGGRKFPSNLLTDNILPYTDNPYSGLYQYLEEVLFSADEINLLKSSEPKFLERREIAILSAKRLKKENKNMTMPEAILEIDSDMQAVELKPYSKKRLSNIISDIGFLPGKRGPKVKK